VTVAGHVDDLRAGRCDLAALGRRLHGRMAEMFPICRSITGDGVRATLDLIDRTVKLERHSVPSGTTAHDWTVNDEWNVRDAYIADADGRRLVDFRENNLHLVSYSTPVRATLTREQLQPHLHTLPEHPDWIPYRTTYYHRTWGFCLTERQRQTMGPGPFEVVVDTEIGPGEMVYGEVVVPGETDREVMITSHVCHPSLANDNLSGIVVAAELARTLQDTASLQYSYRFLFAPGTIGSITWLSRNHDVLPRLRHGLVLTGLGGPGPLVYKATRRGGRGVDRAASHVVRRHAGEVRGYSPYGYDERQFNAVGFDLPFGRLTRTPHGEYPEYHTSADDLAFVHPVRLVEAYTAVMEIIDVLENDGRYRNLSPYGEPQLGKRGLYPTMGGNSATDAVMSMLWTLAYTDGSASLLDIAGVAEQDFADIRTAADALQGAGLLEPTSRPADRG
jgi:aminopeptidase-like protein